MRRHAAWMLALAAAAGAARAEVRLVPDGAGMRVAVTPTPSGPWTALDPTEPGLLNPGGDQAGDGAPAVANADGRWLVAWIAPEQGALRLASATDRWSPILSVPVDGAFGSPLVVRVRDAWVVAMRTSDGRVATVGTTDAGRVSASYDIGSGRLLGGRHAGPSAQLILWERDGRIEVVTVQILAPDPRPIDVYRTPVCRSPLGRMGERRSPWEPREPGDGPLPAGGDDPRWADGGGCHGHAALRDVTLPDGSPGAVLRWSPRPGETDEVTIGDDGSVGAVRVVAGR